MNAQAIKVTEENSRRTGPVNVVTEASMLGLAPGQWPKSIETSMGNCQPFQYLRCETQDGDLVSVTYAQQLGCTYLKILNT